MLHNQMFLFEEMSQKNTFSEFAFKYFLILVNWFNWLEGLFVCGICDVFISSYVLGNSLFLSFQCILGHHQISVVLCPVDNHKVFSIE